MYNESEVDINGTKVILRPTRDEKMRLFEAFAKSTKTKGDNLSEIRSELTNLLYNSLFLWKDNKRTKEKESDSLDTTKEDIDSFVVDNFGDVWTQALDKLDIVKEEDVKKALKAQAKLKENIDPN